MDADAAGRLFYFLARHSDPKVTRVSQILLLGLIIVLLLASILTLLACSLSYFVPRMQKVQRHRRWLITGAFLTLLQSVCASFGISLGAGSLGPLETGVDVKKEELVGIYDVQVVKADEATELIQ